MRSLDSWSTPFLPPFLKKEPPPVSATPVVPSPMSTQSCRDLSSRTADNIQSVEVTRMDFIHTWGSTAADLFKWLTREIRGLIRSDSCSEYVLVGLKRPSKYTFHPSTISSVEVSSFPCTVDGVRNHHSLP